MSIIWPIVIFAAVIFFHELGHFVSARLFGIKVIEFALGMGPVIFKVQRGEVLYSVRMIPIGGCCRIEGEDGESSNQNSFTVKPWYAKFIVLFAGGFMNILLAFLVCMAVIISSKRRVPTTLIVDSFRMLSSFVSVVFQSIGTLVTGKNKIRELSGALGIVDAISKTAKQGLPSLLALTAFINVNLGIFNLLPFPALDGGRIVFVLFEAVFKKSIPPEKEGIVHFVGFSLLILLMIFVSYHDVLRLIRG